MPCFIINFYSCHTCYTLYHFNHTHLTGRSPLIKSFEELNASNALLKPKKKVFHHPQLVRTHAHHFSRSFLNNPIQLAIHLLTLNPTSTKTATFLFKPSHLVCLMHHHFIITTTTTTTTPSSSSHHHHHHHHPTIIIIHHYHYHHLIIIIIVIFPLQEYVVEKLIHSPYMTKPIEQYPESTFKVHDAITTLNQKGTRKI